MTKKEVYVVVDTPKKAKKLKKLLDMFGEPIFNPPSYTNSGHNGTDYGWGYGFSGDEWQGFNTKWLGHNGKKFKKVSIKELRNILAKEHLKEGDYVVSENNFICRIDKVENNGIHFSNPLVGVYDISYFKRYATPEEIDLLEPKEVDKFAELKEAHRKGAVIQWRREIDGDPIWKDCDEKDSPMWCEFNDYRINPSSTELKVGDWMLNPNTKKITQVKKDNHGKSLIGSGWVKIKDTELVEKLNSM